MSNGFEDGLSRRRLLRSGAAAAALAVAGAGAPGTTAAREAEPTDGVDAAPTAPPDAAVVTDGPARFQVLTEGLVRLEYAPSESFEDRPTMTAVDRAFAVPEFETGREDGVRRIETDRVRLRYEVGSGPFTDGNLDVEVRVGDAWREATPAWREPDQAYESEPVPTLVPRPEPDVESVADGVVDRVAGEEAPDPDAAPDGPASPTAEGTARDDADLGGWYRALDNQASARELQPGLLTRDGYRLVDDSVGALRTADAAAPRDRPADYRDGYLFAYGHDYETALGDFAALTGPAPLLPENAFGVWFSRWWPYTDQGYRDLVARFREEGTPLSVLMLDADWSSPHAWNGWNWHPSRFPDPEGFVDWAHDEDLLVSLNVHPSINDDDPRFATADERAGGLLPDNRRGNLYTQSASRTYVWDWADPAHRASYFGLHDRFEAQGVDFWWPDWCCDESRSSMPGVPPDALLNDGYARRQRARGKRGFALSRIGASFHHEGASVPGPWAAHRHAVHFTGDTAPTWEMLDFEIEFTVAENSIGLPYVSHDIGSFHGPHLPDDLYVRWVQFGAFQPILRLHSNHGDRLPWDYTPPAETAAKRVLRLRNRLVPYIYALAREAHDDGLPLCRAMWLAHPTRKPAHEFDRQYLLGEDLLVAPVATPGTTARKEVWFPPGEWVDLFTGERYDGDTVRTVEAPLDRMPVFARAGTVLPLAPLTDRAGERDDHRDLRVYAGDDGEFDLYDDAGEGLAYRDGAFARTPVRYAEGDGAPGGAARALTIAGMTGSYEGRPGERSYDVTFVGVDEPATVTVTGDGDATDWSYDAGERELTVRVPPRPVERRVEIRVRERRVPASDEAGQLRDAEADGSEADDDEAHGEQRQNGGAAPP